MREAGKHGDENVSQRNYIHSHIRVWWLCVTSGDGSLEYSNLEDDSQCRDLKDIQDLRDLNNFKDLKDLKDLQDFRDFKDLRYLKGLKDLKDFLDLGPQRYS